MRAFERAALARKQGRVLEADYWQSIADLTAAAPPLSQSQVDKLAVLLRADSRPEAHEAA